MSHRRVSLFEQITAGLTVLAMVGTQLALPLSATASTLGATSTSAGTAPSPAVSAMQSFQPDLFTGRATTSIPILVPPGRKGIQPTLALTYSSTGRNSWVGVGWSLDMGMIERSTKHGVPSYTSSDTYTLTFQGVNADLVRITDGTYRPQNDGIALRVTDAGTSGWEVRDASGTRYLFGGTPDSELRAPSSAVFRWCLHKVVDRNGNAMTVTYVQDQGQTYLSRIDYTGHDPTGLAPSNDVLFSLEDRADIETSYRGGFASITAKRLSNILVEAQGQQVRQYGLHYYPSQQTSRSLLIQVSQSGVTPYNTLPPTTFAYQGTASTYDFRSNNKRLGTPAWNVRVASAMLPDQNGACLHPYAGLPWNASILIQPGSTRSTGCGFASVSADGSFTFSGCQNDFDHAWTSLYTNSATTLNLSYSGSHACAYVEDQGGIRQVDPSSVTLQAGWSTLHLTTYDQGASFTTSMSAALNSLVTTMNPSRFLMPQISGDFNGDGLTDLATFNPNTLTISVALSTGNGFAPETVWLSGSGSSRTIPLVGDFDGDGKADLCLFDPVNGTWDIAISTGTGFMTPSRWLSSAGFGQEPVVGDFNGDEKLDVGYFDRSTGDLRLALSNGTQFLSPTTWSTGFGTGKTYLTGDFNGDGLTDAASYVAQTGDWQVALSNGRGFQLPTMWVSGFGVASSTGTTDLTIFPSPLPQQIAFYGASSGSSFEPPTTGSLSQLTAIDLHYAGDWTTWASVGIDFNKTLLNLDSQIDLTSASQLIFHVRGARGGEKFVAHIRDATWQGAGMFNTVQARTPAIPTGGLSTTAQDIVFDLSGLILNNPIDLSQLVHLAIEAGAPATLNGNPGNPPGSTVIIEGIHLKLLKPLGRIALAIDCNGDGLTDAAYLDRASGQVLCAPSHSSSFGTEQVMTGTFGQRSEDVQLQMGDFNGDSIPDPAIFSAASGNGQIAYSNYPVPDLLFQIQNPLRARTTITYATSSLFSSSTPGQRAALPFPVHVVSQVDVFDAAPIITGDTLAGHIYTTHYQYADALYDGRSQEFRGFGTVQAIDASGTVTETRFAQDDQAKGRPLSITVKDANGNLFSKQDNTWTCSDPYPAVHTCELTQTDVSTYDGDASFRLARTRHTYDAYGNVTRTDEDGELSVAGDERSTVTELTYNPTDWIVNTPSRVFTLASDGTTILSQRRFYYDQHALSTDIPTQGNLTKEEHWLNGATPSWIATIFTYDSYGNVVTVTDALNHTTTNTYDPTGTYLMKIVNALGHTHAFTYDPRFGVVTQATDSNGVTTTTEYDAFGRVAKVIGPNDTSALPTLSYEYDLTSQPSRTIVHTRIASGSAEELLVYTFLDGLGRTVETRTPAEDSTKQIITGVTAYDDRGLPVKQWLPYLDDASDQCCSSTTGGRPPADAAFATYAHDAVGRLTSVTDPNGSTTSTSYSDWSVTITDAKNHKTTRMSDAYGRLAQVQEFNGVDLYTTRYQYDALNQLTQITDAVGNLTAIAYDSLSRKISMDDPDMGHWTYAYDALGNLSQQTDARGVITSLTYDALNRLTQKTYSVPPTSNIQLPASVSYTYDGANDTSKPFTKGKLTQIADGSGSSAFEYDNLGRLTKESKTIDATTYTIQRSYDLLGRLTSLTYPDNEQALYTYNAQGGIETVALQSPVSGLQPVVSNVDYNAAGQLTKITYGNGTSTDYSYNPLTLRLDHLQTVGSSGTLQDFRYTFDAIGNVTQIQDSVHTATQSFSYDDLSRLTQASGSYGAFSYAYDPIGNMTEKEGIRMSYGLADHTKPHAVTSTSSGLTLSYDVNGNLLGKSSVNGTAQTMSYDAENRLTQVTTATSTPSPLTVTRTLVQGWNVISFPQLSGSTSIASVLTRFGTDYTQLTRWNATTQQFESAINNPSADQFTTLEPDRGYWLYVSNPAGVTLTLTGTPTTPTAETLAAGMHLLPGPAQTMTVAQWLTGLVAGVDYGSVRRYDTTSRSLTSTTQVQSGNAYYVQILRPVTWTPPAAPGTSSSSTTRFLYDGDGGRVKVTTSAGTTTFLGQNVELAPDGTVTKSLFAGSQRIATKTSTGALRFYHSDHLGSSNVISDGTGTLVELAEYTPYGSLTRREGATNVPQKFTGQRLDTSTGLYFYNARYYDPSLGRFLQADTLVPAPGDPQALNRYSYVRNNPLRYTDPSGHGWFSKFFKRFGGTILSVAFMFIGMPVVGALAGSAVNTIANHGSVGDFALGLGIGVASGYAGGSLTGAFARGVGMNLAGPETALLRGAVSGAIGGALGAAVYGGNIGKGALGGALSGAAVGGIMWAGNALITESFLQSHVAWDPNTSGGDRATITQAIREAGQSPRGHVMFGRFLLAGRTLNIHTWNVANAQGTLAGNDMWLNPNSTAYNDPNSSRAWAKTFDQATVFLHELGHNLGYDEVSGKPPFALNVSYNENPYRAWIGSPGRSEYLTNGQLPARQTFEDIDVWR